MSDDSDLLRISAKNLGELALSDFCPRCFWLKQHARHLPYQIFPGIFSSIDAYTKRVVHAWIDQTGGAPVWLRALGEVVGYLEPPHHAHFRMEFPKHGILLTGAPDGIIELGDGSIALIDYKTAKYTPRQDQLLPMYVVQLNAYALIAEHLKLGDVSKLALVYAEPVTDRGTASKRGVHTDGGFMMPFAISIHPVVQNPERIFTLFERARELYSLAEPPRGKPDCEDCKKLDRLVLLARK